MKKNKIVIRQAKKKDLDDLVRIDREAFPPDWPKDLLLNREQFASCIEVFPGGVLVVQLNGKLVGYSLAEVFDYKKAISVNWYQATDNGFIRKSHNPRGDTLFGISMCTARKDRTIIHGESIGLKLMKAIFARSIVKKNLRGCILGSRVPGYHKVAKEMSIDEYVFAKGEEGFAIDPLLAFYQRFGFRILKIMPDYIKDPQSHNYGVLMIVQNPSYKKE